MSACQGVDEDTGACPAPSCPGSGHSRHGRACACVGAVARSVRHRQAYEYPFQAPDYYYGTVMLRYHYRVCVRMRGARVLGSHRPQLTCLMHLIVQRARGLGCPRLRRRETGATGPLGLLDPGLVPCAGGSKGAPFNVCWKLDNPPDHAAPLLVQHPTSDNRAYSVEAHAEGNYGQDVSGRAPVSIRGDLPMGPAQIGWPALRISPQANHAHML